MPGPGPMQPMAMDSLSDTGSCHLGDFRAAEMLVRECAGRPTRVCRLPTPFRAGNVQQTTVPAGMARPISSIRRARSLPSDAAVGDGVIPKSKRKPIGPKAKSLYCNIQSCLSFNHDPLVLAPPICKHPTPK